MKTPKEIVVLAVNRLNAIAKEIIEYELAHFSQFIGKDVTKADGSIKVKYDHKRLEFPREQKNNYGIDVNYYVNASSSCLSVKIRLCINGGTYDVKPNTAFTHYEEMNSTILNMSDNMLVETNIDRSHLNKVYSCAELQAKAIELELLTDAYNKQVAEFPWQFTDLFDVKKIW